MNWFYESAGQQQGPVTDRDLDRLLAEGKITIDTLIWKEGMPNWQPLREARPQVLASQPAPEAPPTLPSQPLPPGYVRCALTGKQIPESEAVYISGKPYSAEAKATVLQSLQQGAGLPAAHSPDRTGPAWEDRVRLGWFQAILDTVKAVLLEPSATFSTMRRDGGLGTPLLFYFIVGGVGMIFANLCIFAANSFGLIPRSPGTAQALGMTSTADFVITMVLVPIQILVGSFIYAGVLHLSLMICGGAKQGFESTFRVVCYGQGAVSALFLVPVCGWVASIVWSIVVTCIGLARTHEINTGRAVIAFFLPTVVCCLGLVLLGVGIAAAATAASSGVVPAP